MEYTVTIREEVEYEISLDASDVKEAIERAEETIVKMYSSTSGATIVDVKDSVVLEVCITGEE